MSLVTLFFAGLFVANGIPHFVHGISGKKFPSPFAKPPGKGLSSSIVNVIWGLTNFLIAILLFKTEESFSIGLNAGFLTFALGFVIASVGLAGHFSKADREYRLE